MQAFAKLRFFDVADKAVDARDRLGGTHILGQAKALFEARGAGLFADRVNQSLAPFGI